MARLILPGCSLPRSASNRKRICFCEWNTTERSQRTAQPSRKCGRISPFSAEHGNRRSSWNRFSRPSTRRTRRLKRRSKPHSTRGVLGTWHYKKTTGKNFQSARPSRNIDKNNLPPLASKRQCLNGMQTQLFVFVHYRIKKRAP